MKKIQSLLAIPVIAMMVTSCSNSSPAEKVSGTYTGNYTVNSFPAGAGSSDIAVVNDNAVNMSFIYNSNADTVMLNSVSATESGDNVVLTYTDAGQSMSGTLTGGNSLSCTYTTSGITFTFTGSK